MPTSSASIKCTEKPWCDINASLLFRSAILIRIFLVVYGTYLHDPSGWLPRYTDVDYDIVNQGSSYLTAPSEKKNARYPFFNISSENDREKSKRQLQTYMQSNEILNCTSHALDSWYTQFSRFTDQCCHTFLPETSCEHLNTFHGRIKDIFQNAPYFPEHSPFQRVTYRYSSLLALITAPGHLLGISSLWGKLIFCASDILVALLLQKILSIIFHAQSPRLNSKSRIRSRPSTKQELDNTLSQLLPSLYLLHPLVLNISTRGNADSLTAALPMLSTLYFLCVGRPMIAGALFGLATHLRLFPILFTPLLLFGSLHPHTDTLLPRLRAKTVFLLTASFSFLCTLLLGYLAFGFQALYEGMLYHFSRVDHRHNLSPYFLMFYLRPDVNSEVHEAQMYAIAKHVPLLLQLVCILTVFYSLRARLPVGLFFTALLFVTFNKVHTVQYAVWYLSVSPVNHTVHHMRCRNAFVETKRFDPRES